MNQLAHKLDNEIKFSAILPNNLFKVWQEIKKYLERSCKRSNGRHTINTIYKQIISNEATLWVAFDSNENIIKGCVITTFIYYPTDMKMLHISQLAGKNMQEWIEIGRPVLNNWAKDNQCHGIEAMGRKGFSHWSTKKDESWQESHVHFEMKFKEKE
jgi:hypothetical protein|tara:strand:+ start:497 stop:967 length:471 start_codon:yes stop_codon:yes gene_type:complete